jgi:hypothetical protein
VSNKTRPERATVGEDFGARPTNKGSNSNFESDGTCAAVFMRVETMEAQQALN